MDPSCAFVAHSIVCSSRHNTRPTNDSVSTVFNKCIFTIITWMFYCTGIQAPMNLSHVVTIGTFRGGSVGGLEEGKGVQPILGRKNPLAKYKTAQSCCQKMRLGFSQIYHHLLKLLTSLFDILQPFSEISSINLKFIPLKLMTILRSEKKSKIFENLTT